MELKKVGQLALIAAVCSLVGWVAMYVFWHFKILGGINTLEQQSSLPMPGLVRASYVPEEAEQALNEAGCRGILYLVNSLKTYKNPCYPVLAYEILARVTSPTLDGITDPKAAPLRTPVPSLAEIKYTDQPSDRDAKITMILKWWQENQKDWHAGWRVWSNHCPKPKSR